MPAPDPAGETLGDILGRALRGDVTPAAPDLGRKVADLLAGCSGRTDEVEPQAYWWPTIDAHGEVTGEREVTADEWWRVMSSWRAGLAIAAHYGLSFEDVRHVLQRIPDNLTVLLDSPQGWTVLAEQVAITITGTLPGEPMLPTLQ